MERPQSCREDSASFGSKTQFLVQDSPLTSRRTWGNLNVIYRLETMIPVESPSWAQPPAAPTPAPSLIAVTSELQPPQVLLPHSLTEGEPGGPLLAKKVVNGNLLGLLGELLLPCKRTRSERRVHWYQLSFLLSVKPGAQYPFCIY